VPDLPAHGARFKEVPLTLDNAVKTLEDIIAKEAPGEKVRALSSISYLFLIPGQAQHLLCHGLFHNWL
jgi:hypothetical protein